MIHYFSPGFSNNNNKNNKTKQKTLLTLNVLKSATYQIFPLNTQNVLWSDNCYSHNQTKQLSLHGMYCIWLGMHMTPKWRSQNLRVSGAMPSWALKYYQH